jgi:hypothetical protein
VERRKAITKRAGGTELRNVSARRGWGKLSGQSVGLYGFESTLVLWGRWSFPREDGDTLIVALNCDMPDNGFCGCLLASDAQFLEFFLLPGD